MADITRFNTLKVRGEIYRDKQVNVCINCRVWSEHKFSFRAF